MKHTRLIVMMKWLTVPFSNETKRVEVVRLWEVRWESRHGRYFSDTKPEVEAFTSEDDATEFATALRQAFALIRHTSGDVVRVRLAK